MTEDWSACKDALNQALQGDESMMAITVALASRLVESGIVSQGNATTFLELAMEISPEAAGLALAVANHFEKSVNWTRQPNASRKFGPCPKLTFTASRSWRLFILAWTGRGPQTSPGRD